MIVDYASSTDVLSEFVKSGSSPYADPLAAYAAWAGVLGIGTIGTSLTRTFDGTKIVNPGIAVLSGGATNARVLVVSEGGVTLSKVAEFGSSAVTRPITASSPQYSVGRFYGHSNSPSIALTFHPPAVDYELRNGKYEVVAGTATIIYVRWDKDNVWGYAVEAALRLSADRIEICVKAENTVSAPDAYFQVLRGDTGSTSFTAYSGSGAFVEALPAGTTVHYLSEILAGNNATGFKSTTFGTPTFFGNATAVATGTKFGSFGTTTVDYDPPTLSTLVFQDTFTGADNTEIDTRAPDVGYDWAHSGGGYDAAGRIKIFGNAAAINNSSYYPAYNTDIPVYRNTYRLKVAFKLPATLISSDVFMLIENSVNGPSPYAIKCYTDTDALDIKLTGATQGSVADAFNSAYYHDDGTAGGTTVVAELIVDRGRASWFYIDTVLQEFRIRAIEGEQANYLNVAMSGAGIELDYVEVYAESLAYTPNGTKFGSFGNPVATWAQAPEASGFKPTQFGTPQFVGKAYGFQPITFGTPRGFYSGLATTLGEVAQFGTPHAPRLQTLTATGDTRTRFGRPFISVVIPTIQHVLVYAFGSVTTEFGTPGAAFVQTLTTTGSTFPAFGTARVQAGGSATGASTTAFGAPAVITRTRATGARTTTFGTASAKQNVLATALHQPTRFGLPKVVRDDVYEARGFRAGRFGRATAFSRFNHPATGFTSTQLGTPTALDRHRAFHLPPGTQFGTPQLNRGATC